MTLTQHRNFKHGESGGGDGSKMTKEYIVWRAMHQRCTDRNLASYLYYGYVGITVCPTWDSFVTFLEDMGRCPVGHTLERKNNTKPYSPENCAWTTRHEQSRNKSNNVWLEAENKRMIQQDWATELGINERTITRHLRAGESFTSIVRIFRERCRIGLYPFYLKVKTTNGG